MRVVRKDIELEMKWSKNRIKGFFSQTLGKSLAPNSAHNYVPLSLDGDKDPEANIKSPEKNMGFLSALLKYDQYHQQTD